MWAAVVQGFYGFYPIGYKYINGGSHLFKRQCLKVESG